MPYTNKTHDPEPGYVKQTWNGALVSSRDNSGFNYPAHGKVSYVRTGTNAAKQLVESCRPVDRRITYGWELRAVPFGPRLPVKVWSKRKQQWVWKRELIVIKKLVKIYPPRSPKRPKKGLDLPPNALSYASASVSYFGKHLDIDVTNGSDKLTISGSLYGQFVPFGSLAVAEPHPVPYMEKAISPHFVSYVNDANQAAITRLYDKVKNQQVNLAQVLAEYRQSAALFADVAKRLVKVFKLVKKRQFNLAVGELLPGSFAGAGSTHLAIQYGLRPLIGDLEGITTLLTSGRDVLFDIVVRVKREVPRTLVSSSNRPYGLTWIKTEVHSFGYVEVKYKYRCRVTSPGMALKRTLSELGFGNLNSLAWEAIPFSFVVDWALPIGNYLNNRDAFDNLEVVASTKTVFQKEYIHFQRTFGGTDSGFYTSHGTTGFVTERVSCDRTLVDLPPLPLPSFKDPRSTMHIANAIALLFQLKGKS